MQARYYDPVIGRFLSPDPVTFAEGGTGYFNRYAYVRGDPVNMVDPDGRQGRPLGSYGDLRVDFSDAEARELQRRNSESAWRTMSVANDLFNPLSDVGTFLADPTPLTFAIMAAGALPGPNVGGKVLKRIDSPVERQVDIYEVPGTDTPSGKPYIGSGLTDGKRRDFTGDGRDRSQSTLVERVPESQRRPAEQRAMNERGGVDKLDNRRNEIRERCWPDCGVDPPD